MDLNSWFDSGITKEAYVARLDDHKESFTHIYDNLEILQSEADFFDKLKKRNLRVIAIAEEWCGHCMLNIPILLRLTEMAHMPIRFLPRDENVELMDQYLTNGNRVIPIIIFIDEAGNEVAKWGPLAPKVKDFTTELRNDLPKRDSEEYQEEFNKLKVIITSTFRNDSSYWQSVYNDMKSKLQ